MGDFMDHRQRFAVLGLLTALAACQQGGSKEQPVDGATIRLASAFFAGAGTDVGALADRDTTTGSQVTAPVTVEVNFDHDVEARALKLFVRGTVEAGGAALVENCMRTFEGLAPAWRVSARHVVIAAVV